MKTKAVRAYLEWDPAPEIESFFRVVAKLIAYTYAAGYTFGWLIHTVNDALCGKCKVHKARLRHTVSQALSADAVEHMTYRELQSALGLKTKRYNKFQLQQRLLLTLAH